MTGVANIPTTDQRSVYRAWFAESWRAKDDAIALLLGSITAVGVLALMRPEFSSAPLRVVIDNWAYWSHLLWGTVGRFFVVEVSQADATTMTAIAISLSVFARGVLRGQLVARSPAGLLPHMLATTIGAPLGARLWSYLTNQSYTSEDVLGFYLGLTGLIAFLHTPRAFWATALAVAVLLGIDRIPVLPASV